MERAPENAALVLVPLEVYQAAGEHIAGLIDHY
jgi:hypothetical protein